MVLYAVCFTIIRQCYMGLPKRRLADHERRTKTLGIGWGHQVKGSDFQESVLKIGSPDAGSQPYDKGKPHVVERLDLFQPVWQFDIGSKTDGHAKALVYEYGRRWADPRNSSTRRDTHTVHYFCVDKVKEAYLCPKYSWPYHLALGRESEML